MASPLPPTVAVFPFFELPRELRDMIYIESLTEYTYIFGDVPTLLRVVASNVPIANGLATNRKFHDEYREQGEKRSTITVSDIRYTRDTIEAVKLPPAAVYISALNFNLAILSTEHSTEGEQFELSYLHAFLIERFTETMSNYRSLHIRIELGDGPLDPAGRVRTVNRITKILDSGGWRELDKLQSLNVYRTFDQSGIRSQMHEMGVHFDYPLAKNLLSEWSADTKELIKKGCEQDWE